MYYPKFTFRFGAFIIVPAVSMAFLFSCCPPTEIQENYVLAYVNMTNQIVVRSREARTGTTWLDGRFPTNVPAGLGVGLAADTSGVMHIIFTNNQGSANVRMVWGLGPAVWDNSAVSTSAMIPASSISAVSLGGNRWLVAYQQTGATLFAGIFNSTTKRFLSNVAPMGPLNSNVKGRPCVARLHNRVVLVWQRRNGALFDLVTATGQIQDGNVVFEAPRIVSTPATAGLGGGIVSEPVVTTNMGAFYMLVVREQRAAGVSNGWGAQLIGSNDGANWRLLTIVNHLVVNADTYLAAAGASNGKILVASLRKFTAGRALQSAVMYGNGTWTALSDAQVAAMFGGNTAYKPFTLIDSKP